MLVLNVLIVVVAVLQTALARSTLRWMMPAWHRPDAYESIGLEPTTPPPGAPLSFSLIVPCRDESWQVMAETVRRLLNQDHRQVQIVISVGDDDHETVAPALLLAIWSYAYRPTRWFSLVGATMAMIMTGAMYPLFARGPQGRAAPSGTTSSTSTRSPGPESSGPRTSTVSCWSAGGPASD